MTRILLLASYAICCSALAQDDGMPFGRIGDADVDRLAEFAKKSGFDLKPEMERVYKKDEEALARLFKLLSRIQDTRHECAHLRTDSLQQLAKSRRGYRR